MARLTDRDRILRTISETEFQNNVIEMAHTYRWIVAHFRPVRIQRGDGSVYFATPVAADGEGYPDLHFVRENDRSFYAELKRQDGTVRPAQQTWIDLLRSAGETVFVWRPSDMDEIQAVLE